ncbi:serine/threonine-protein kinase [Thermomonospora curvata]|uniref:non-specific serine/threonine protein kinase n=1 Tax=Thermomonospora curvata (strain ATCC 19995 / DSM 43183 / JCM 3096 / KCTC 9072 / NBRC 15933 / NCIMB 10081 / Henssen B9) TaxID=471852 RepID=D1A5M8_THECD|nr:serine/threonine-protein kinase [Thermomonospora curvata]ACY96388.1 serine/threonine protein kinase [Thermomonospora curvata DSM 43183]
MSIPSSVGRYRIDRVLGSGAFASVWLGHDDALAVPVAIKVLSGSLLDDLDVRNRFLEEARILRRADSERLVRVHDIGELPDGRPYFVMSYADRGTLADRMRGGLLPVPTALAFAEEIARGVQVINQLGVIHRDLKPSNVLFQSTPDGGEKLLIADLGLAKAIAHASGAFTLPVGTPGYMSPEQARFGGGLDVRADVYGLGALTYHMLTGKAPGPAPVKTRPSELRAELTPEFDRVILRAMEVDREKRWPTAEAFAQALVALRSSVEAESTGGGRPPAEAAPAGSEAAAPPAEGGRARPEPATAPDVPFAEPAQARPEPAGGEDAAGSPGERPMPSGLEQTVVDNPGLFDAAGQARPPAGDIGQERTVAMSREQFPARPHGGTPEVPFGPARTSGGPGRPGDDGATAVLPPPPQGGGAPGGFQGPPPAPPPGPGGPWGPGGPGGSTAAPRPSAGEAEQKRRRQLLALSIGAGLVVIVIVGGLLLNAIGSGGGAKPAPSPTPPKDFVAVSDASGKIRAFVPKAWPKLAEPTTWQPSSVGLSGDTQSRPVLRATSGSFQQFLDSTAKTPGVFIGLTTDVGEGRLPPPGVSEHDQCTKGQPERYTTPDQSLSGTIIRYTGCSTGTPSITEVGLVDRTGKFGVWIRVKEIDDRKVTNDILNSLRLAAP